MFSKQTLGMTLIELMVTMAILAVIAAIAIPMYNGYIATAQNTEGWNDLGGIRLAQEEFFLENGEYFDGDSGAGTLGTYYTPSEGADRNFNYVVVGDTVTWTATATGRGGIYDVPASVSFSLSR